MQSLRRIFSVLLSSNPGDIFADAAGYSCSLVAGRKIKASTFSPISRRIASADCSFSPSCGLAKGEGVLRERMWAACACVCVWMLRGNVLKRIAVFSVHPAHILASEAGQMMMHLVWLKERKDVLKLLRVGETKHLLLLEAR